MVVLQRKKNQQNMAKSDYIERPSKISMLDRVEQKSFDKNRKKEEIAKVLNHYDRAGSKNSHTRFIVKHVKSGLNQYSLKFSAQYVEKKH